MEFGVFPTIDGNFFQPSTKAFAFQMRRQILAHVVDEFEDLGLLKQLEDGEEPRQLVAVTDVTQLNECGKSADRYDDKRSQRAHGDP